MNFRQVRKKIKTVGNVKQITKAMQMVSSVKMKKSQEVAVEGKPYREILDSVVKRILATTEKDELTFLSQKSTSDNKLYVFISSNKGLCGSFNFNLFKLVFSKIDIKKSNFITIGKKGAELITRLNGSIDTDFSDQVPFVDQASSISTRVQEAYVNGECNSVHVIYNSFVSTLQQEPKIVKILPIDKEELSFESEGNEKEISAMYKIEPSPKEVLEALIRDYITDKIRGSILESDAAEHSARMMAMKNATDNASDLIVNLTLLRNKLRQASITNQLLEITTAKESSEYV